MRSGIHNIEDGHTNQTAETLHTVEQGFVRAATPAGAGGDALLLEDGSFLLLESQETHKTTKLVTESCEQFSIEC